MQPPAASAEPTPEADADRIALLEREVARLGDELRTVLAAARSTTPGVSAAASVSPERPTTVMGRRKALTAIAGVAVAGVAGAAVLGDATPAAAVTTTYLEINNSANASQTATQLVVDAGGAHVKSGLGVTDATSSVNNSASALVGHAKGVTFDNAISAIAEGPAAGLSVHTAQGSAGSFYAEANTTMA